MTLHITFLCSMHPGKFIILKRNIRNQGKPYTIIYKFNNFFPWILTCNSIQEDKIEFGSRKYRSQQNKTSQQNKSTKQFYKSNKIVRTKSFNEK